MKKLLGLGLIALTLISCGENKSEDTFGKLKGDITVLNTKDDQYFSSSIKYKCEDEENCNQNVVLVAIKNKKQLNTCTGALVSPSEVLVASTCFERPLEELNRACSEKIEIHSIKKSITKCNSVRSQYSADNGIQLYKINLNENLDFKITSKDKNKTVVYTNSKNHIQKYRNCSFNYTSINHPSSVSHNSELLHINNCKDVNGIIHAESLMGFKYSSDLALNAKCLTTGGCIKNETLKDKFVSLLSQSTNQSHKNFIRFINKDSINTRYFKATPSLDIRDKSIVAYNKIECMTENSRRVFDRDMHVSYKLVDSNIRLLDGHQIKQRRYIPINLTNNFDHFKENRTIVSAFESKKSTFYLSKNEDIPFFEFKNGNIFIVPNDKNNLISFTLCN